MRRFLVVFTAAAVFGGFFMGGARAYDLNPVTPVINGADVSPSNPLSVSPANDGNSQGVNSGDQAQVTTVPNTTLTAASGNKANASAAATLAATAAETTYISGFEITAGGATAGACVNPTVTGVIGGTLTYTFCAPTGVAVGATPLVVQFNPPLPASAVDTAIVVTLPALGSGNAEASVVAHGYVQ